MRRSVTLLIAMTLLAAACGGDGDGGAGVDTEAATGTGDTAAESLAELTVLEPGAERRAADAEAFAAASTGDALDIADLLRTDTTGWVEIGWFDGSLTRLDADTEFEIVAIAGTPDAPEIQTRLDVGRTWHRVESVSGDDGSFEVETAVATAAVRGTAFVVICLPDGTCIFAVIEGVVVVTVGGQEFELSAGDQLTVRPDGTTDGVEAVGLDELRADPWVARNLEQDGDDGGPAEAAPEAGRFDALGSPDGTDPSGDISVAAVDVISTRSGTLPDDGRAWVLFEFAGDWPPSEDLFSWFVELQGFDADGNQVNRAGTEYHDGVRTMAADPVEEQAVDGGLLFIIPAPPSVDLEINYYWLARVWPSESDPIEEDLPEGGPLRWQFDNVQDPRAGGVSVTG